MKYYEQMKACFYQQRGKIMAVSGMVTGLVGIIANEPDLICLGTQLEQMGIDFEPTPNPDHHYKGE